jgi:hypothetical protein
MRLAIPAMIAVALTACTAGSASSTKASGRQDTRSFPAEGFNRVELAGSDNVVIKVGGRESVSATGDSAVLDRLEIEVRGGELRVGRKRNSGWVDLGGGQRGHATITVTLPALKGASVAGSGNLDVDRASGDDFAASVAGSGNLRVATLQTHSASFDIAGSGNLSAAGSATSLSVSIAGSGDVDAGALKSDQAKISVAGSGGVKAGVNGQATVSIMGSGDVDITGTAKCSVTKMGSGSVRCGS